MRQYIDLDGKRYRRRWNDFFNTWTHEVEVSGRPGCWRRLDRARNAKRIAQVDAAFKAQ